jgi:hypothetical protein
MASCRRFRGRLCPNGKRRKRKEIGGHSLASPGHCRASFHRLFYLARLAVHSCRRRRGSRLIRIGVHIHFALIVWRAPLLPAVERLAAGPGGSTRTARTGCQPHSVHHPRPIGNMHPRWAQAFAVCAGNRFIASAGMSNCGTPGPTRMRSGTAHAWSHGNSGPRRVITRGFCGACKHGAAPRLGLVFGRTQRLTTASHYSGFGLNTVTFPGLSCSDSGACPTSKSLTVTSTSQNVRAKCGTGARPALGVRVSLIA